MIDYEKEFEKPGYQLNVKTLTISQVFKVVYGWMAVGLAFSGIVAYMTIATSFGQRIIAGPGFMVFMIAEVALVLILSMGFQKLSAFACTVLFLLYAALNGITLSIIFYVYEISLIAQVFFITAGMFLGLVVWGTVTKGNLASIGAICGMALWGIILAGIVNIFVRSSGLDFICSFVGILVFTGLTMYDAQKIKSLAAHEGTLDSTTVAKVGIMGALALYLDFINLFLHILRFMGRKK